MSPAQTALLLVRQDQSWAVEGVYDQMTDDPWETEPTTWPIRQPHLPPLSAHEFATQVVIPMPRGSSEWLDRS